VSTPAGQKHDDLPSAIADLAGLIAAARQATEAGEMVELDIVAMRIAVLCDAVGDLDPAVARPLRPALAAVMQELDALDFALRRRNVDLSLDMAEAERRLRAQAVYGTKPGSNKPDTK
jgi:hypothetical protein